MHKHIHGFFEILLDVIGMLAMAAAFFVPWGTLEKIMLFAVGFMLFLLVWS